MDQILAGLSADSELSALPRPLIKEHAVAFLDICREEIRSGAITEPKQLHIDNLMPRLVAYVRSQSRPTFGAY